MKYFFVELLILFSGLTLNAGEYAEEWVAALNNGGDDFAQAIALNPWDHVFVGGYSTINGHYAYFAVIYDSLGNIFEADTFRDSADDYAMDIAVDSSNNVYMTGYLISGSNYGILTVKFTPAGNIAWVDTFDYGNYDEGTGIAVDKYKYVYVTGAYYNGSDYDYLTLKYDSLGNLLWADTLNFGNNDVPFDIAVDKNGYIYVAGAVQFSSIYQMVTVKYNPSGNMERIDTLYNYNGHNSYATSIALDNKNNIYIAGYRNNGSDNDYYLAKLDSSGNLLWADSLDNGNGDYAYGVAVDNKGNVYITGASYINSNYDFLTVKYDSLGNLICADTLDNGDNDYGYGVAVDGTGAVYVTGYSYTNNNDYITVKYRMNNDPGIISIASGDTVNIDSTYIPQVWVKNYSYSATLTFDVAAYIDTSGTQIYADTQTVSNLAAGDSMVVNFSPWTPPSKQGNFHLGFSIITSNLNTDNDTISEILYTVDTTFPVLDSAIASDGSNPVSGIDDDDYVILYFSEPTNKPTIDNSNIDSVLALSGGHTWLDGFGGLGNTYWNSDGTQLMIKLTTNISLPTIAVGDTITPDGATITDINGNPCSSPVILGGTFEPAGIKDKNIKKKMGLSVLTLNKNVISFSYTSDNNIPYSISLYTIDGRRIKQINAKGNYNGKFSALSSGIYFIKVKQGDKITNKKVVLIK